MRIPISKCFTLCLFIGLFTLSSAGQVQDHWVGSWAASQQEPEPRNALAPADLTDATLRQIVHLSLGGERIRVRLSNRFGTEPLRFSSVHIARPAPSGSIVVTTDQGLRFHGESDVTIPAGAEYLSDPIWFPVAALSDLSVTLHISQPPAHQTGHPGSRATSYLAHGNLVSAAALTNAKQVEHWYFIAGVDIAAPPQADALVILGDSITDGHGATTDGNDRWPDLLSKRLQTLGPVHPVAVLNHGIGGNRLLLDGLGPNALARFEHNVIAQAGVRYLIILEGVNDLGMFTREHEVSRQEHDDLVHRMISAYEQMIARARTHGIRAIGGTIMPFVGSEFYHPGPDTEADRQAINRWIRAAGDFDAVIDFDQITRDPSHPDRLLPTYDSGDHLHPSSAGYAAMAEAVPLVLFDPVTPPITAEQDHQRLMETLHISQLRRGPDGDPKSPNAANVEEAKVKPYTLPDTLTLKNGTRVATPEMWWKQRRPEILEQFDREVYGRVPAHTPAVNWDVVGTASENIGGMPATTKTLLGHVDNSAYPLISVDIQLSLTVPANAAGPVPVMMEFGLPPELLAMLRRRFTPAQLAAFEGTGPTWQQQVLAKGWGYAILIPTSAQDDNGEGLARGIIGLVNRGQPRKLDDWGALRAWAWAASRALDYFETDKSVDARQVGIEGLSRYGKAALVTMAYDSRFAIGFIGSSGAGGAKILRRNFGEQVENLASTSEYHWFAGNFLKFAGPQTAHDLPVDAHELIALCAPRPVFISSGSQQVEGGWVDAKGMFLGAVGAGPVYKLLGKKDVGATEFPPTETPLIDGDIAFRQHSGGHTTGPNWPTFLTFASRYIKGPPNANIAFVQHSVVDSPTAKAEVALTFDDLPAHGPLPAGMTRVDVIKSIIKALKAAHAPPIYGFVNAKRLDEDPSTLQVLQLWREAGYPLGNHTYSHMDLNTNSIEAFEQDFIADEPILKKLMGTDDYRWLRFPFLREGDTQEKHRAIENFLHDRGYRVAEVTLSFADYAYNEPYARCVARNDQDGIEKLKQLYMSAAADSLPQGQQYARSVFGHDIKHVMLLHIGAFQTVMLPQLLSLLDQKGFKLVSLPDAESDSAYASDADLPSDWGGTFLQQMARVRHIPLEKDAADRTEQLNAICR